MAHVRKFTFTDAFEIQEKQLNEWATILKPEKFALLKAHVDAVNKTAKRPDDVFRGVEIDEWIANNLKGSKSNLGITDDAPYTFTRISKILEDAMPHHVNKKAVLKLLMDFVMNEIDPFQTESDLDDVNLIKGLQALSCVVRNIIEQYGTKLHLPVTNGVREKLLSAWEHRVKTLLKVKAGSSKYYTLRQEFFVGAFTALDIEYQNTITTCMPGDIMIALLKDELFKNNKS